MLSDLKLYRTFQRISPMMTTSASVFWVFLFALAVVIGHHPTRATTIVEASCNSTLYLASDTTYIFQNCRWNHSDASSMMATIMLPTRPTGGPCDSIVTNVTVLILASCTSIPLIRSSSSVVGPSPSCCTTGTTTAQGTEDEVTVRILVLGLHLTASASIHYSLSASGDELPLWDIVMGCRIPRIEFVIENSNVNIYSHVNRSISTSNPTPFLRVSRIGGSRNNASTIAIMLRNTSVALYAESPQSLLSMIVENGGGSSEVPLDPTSSGGSIRNVLNVIVQDSNITVHADMTFDYQGDDLAAVVLCIQLSNEQSSLNGLHIVLNHSTFHVVANTPSTLSSSAAVIKSNSGKGNMSYVWVSGSHIQCRINGSYTSSLLHVQGSLVTNSTVALTFVTAELIGAVAADTSIHTFRASTFLNLESQLTMSCVINVTDSTVQIWTASGVPQGQMTEIVAIGGNIMFVQNVLVDSVIFIYRVSIRSDMANGTIPYSMQQGISTSTMVLATAMIFSVPNAIIHRAQVSIDTVNINCRYEAEIAGRPSIIAVMSLCSVVVLTGRNTQNVVVDVRNAIAILDGNRVAVLGGGVFMNYSRVFVNAVTAEAPLELVVGIVSSTSNSIVFNNVSMRIANTSMYSTATGMDNLHAIVVLPAVCTGCSLGLIGCKGDSSSNNNGRYDLLACASNCTLQQSSIGVEGHLGVGGPTYNGALLANIGGKAVLNLFHSHIRMQYLHFATNSNGDLRAIIGNGVASSFTLGDNVSTVMSHCTCLSYLYLFNAACQPNRRGVEVTSYDVSWNGVNPLPSTVIFTPDSSSSDCEVHLNVVPVTRTLTATPSLVLEVAPRLTPDLAADVTPGMAATIAVVLGAATVVSLSPVAQSLAIFGQSPCAPPALKAVTGAAQFLVSPFYPLGTIGIVLGNSGLLLVVFLVQLITVKALQRRHTSNKNKKQPQPGAAATSSPSLGRGNQGTAMMFLNKQQVASRPTHDVASPLPPEAQARFPNLTLIVSSMCLSGVARSGVTSLFEGSAASIVLGIVAIAAIVAALVGWRRVATSNSVRRIKFAPYRAHVLRSSKFLPHWALPLGRWGPPAATSVCGKLRGSIRPSAEWMAPYSFYYSLATSAIAGLSLPAAYCVGVWIVLAMAALLLGFVVVYYRPARVPLADYWEVAMLLCSAALQIGAGVAVFLVQEEDTGEEVEETTPSVAAAAATFVVVVSFIKSSVALLKTIHRVIVMLWERQRKPQDVACSVPISGEICLSISLPANTNNYRQQATAHRRMSSSSSIRSVVPPPTNHRYMSTDTESNLVQIIQMIISKRTTTSTM